MRTPTSRMLCLTAAVAVSGFIFGYVGEAAALDRQPAVGGVAGSGSRGYGAERPRSGAERPGYGAERDYYGASNLRSASDDDRGYGRDRYRSRGSVIEFGDDGFGENDGGYPNDAEDGSRAGVYPSLGYGGGGSVIYLDDQAAEQDDEPEAVLPSGPRIIDVEAERLDRHPVAKGSVRISYVGGAKIIRIGSGEGERATRDARPALAPWSEPWSRYCTRAYPDFDPERGTYTARDGSIRFCSGG